MSSVDQRLEIRSAPRNQHTDCRCGRAHLPSSFTLRIAMAPGLRKVLASRRLLDERRYHYRPLLSPDRPVVRPNAPAPNGPLSGLSPRARRWFERASGASVVLLSTARRLAHCGRTDGSRQAQGTAAAGSRYPERPCALASRSTALTDRVGADWSLRGRRAAAGRHGTCPLRAGLALVQLSRAVSSDEPRAPGFDADPDVASLARPPQRPSSVRRVTTGRSE